jgi:Family of unknown function (DUF6496)
MPEKQTLERARQAKRRGKRPTSQAGEFVREEIHHIRAGKHGARSTKQAIAIGLSKARRAGVKLGRPPKGTKAKTRQSATYASRAARRGHRRPSRTRSRAIVHALDAHQSVPGINHGLDRDAPRSGFHVDCTCPAATHGSLHRTNTAPRVT